MWPVWHSFLFKYLAYYLWDAKWGNKDMNAVS